MILIGGRTSKFCRGWRWIISVVSRDALWPNPAEPCEAVPAVPQDARRHLHKAAPVLALLYHMGEHVKQTGTPGCSSFSLLLYRAATQTSPLDVLSLLSDQPVCGAKMTFLTRLERIKCCSYPVWGSWLCITPGPQGGWPEVSVWCAALRQKGGGKGGAGRGREKKSADCTGTATHVTSRLSLSSQHCVRVGRPWTDKHSHRLGSQTCCWRIKQSKTVCLQKKRKRKNLNRSTSLHKFKWMTYI